MRALLVGPPTPDLDILVSVLGRRAFEAVRVADPAAARLAAERERFPLIAVDTDAPGGLALVAALRDRPAGSHLVILGLTRDHSLERARALVTAQCSDYLLLPLDAQAAEARLLVVTTWVHGNSTMLEVATSTTAEAAERVAESEARYRALADAADEGVVVHENGIIQFYNRAFADMFGYDAGVDALERGELVGRHVTLLHPDNLRGAVMRQIAEPPRNHGELIGLRKDGSRFPLAVHAREVEVGGRVRRVAALRDLTVQKAAEQALRESNARFELVARATNDAVYDWSVPTGRILWNDALHTLFGYQGDPADADIEWWSAQIHPDDVDRVSTSLDRAITSGAEYWTEEYRFTRADGTHADVIDRGLLMRDATGAATRMIGVMTDVTAFLQMRSRLVLADRMASVGTLAAGVAHEINNPLTWVMAKVALASEQLAAMPPSSRVDVARSALEFATDGAQRIRQIVKDLKLFSRAEEESHLPVDVRRVLDSAASIANAEIRQRARLVKAYGEVPKVDVNEARLGQVFLNLIINAAQAIPPGNPDQHSITLATSLDEDGRVLVEVKDTGAGIPPTIRTRIFDAFFTTKPPGEGTGLGLAICRELVMQMGGEIDVESALGVGTTFQVRLAPIQRLVDPTPSELPSHLEAGPRRGRVMLIDDEQMIVSFLERVVELEHDIESFTEPRRALQRLLAGERYDVILCDLMMPEVTGPDIFNALTRAAPDQASRVIFITGGAFTSRVRTFLDETRAPVLEKPFDIRVLLKMLRERVDAVGK